MRCFRYRAVLAVMLAMGLALVSHELSAQEGSDGANTDRLGEGKRVAESDSGSGLQARKRAGHGMGRGMRHGRSTEIGHAFGRGHTTDERHDSDREVFHYLLQHHQQISRQVKELPNGVETVTESEVEEIADKIKEHVAWMEVRIKNAHPIRMRDPLFAELFRHTDKIKMVHEETPNGVKVIETSDDPYVARLIKEHAKTVSGFVQNGFAEAAKNHPVPPAPSAKESDLLFPAVASYGGVIRLPEAAMQPQNGTKLLVDLTRSSDPAELNRALEKVAKYLNLYAGAGKVPANVEVAVVFHGEATLNVLNTDAYTKRFGTSENPNLKLLKQLHEAGVEMYVCGQALISKEASPNDVASCVKTAVSALTAVVNLQTDGFAYVPLAN